jgi:arabinogalactan endo-1,4-beta-galactosidase
MRRRTVLALPAGIALSTTLPAAASPVVLNPGFEDGPPGTAIPGWSSRGDAAASFTEAGGHSGAQRLSHWADTPYRVETFQRLTGLPSGTYTLRAAVRCSGEQHHVSIGLDDRRVELPRTGPEWWVQVALSTRVSGGRATISIRSDAPAGAWINVDDIRLYRSDGREGMPIPIRGADVSSLPKNEDHGAVYYDRSGRRRDPVAILADNGVNFMRLKVWVNPADGYNDKAHVLAIARRAKAHGMGLLVDFHYSDAWADPGKQNKPAAWADLPFDGLRQAVYDHTFDVLSALRAQRTPADLAQLGNEINGGMLWPDGRWDNWDGLAALLTAGSNATKAASPRTKVVLHLAEGGNNGGHRWWFDNAVSRGVPFDIIAVSQYVYWHGPLGYLQANLNDLTARYDKPVMMVETAYGFTLAEQDHETNIFNASLAAAGGYPATPEGQAKALRDMFTTVASVDNARGVGVFYWEPTWTAVAGGGWDPADPASGDGWENQALFDYRGRALPALKEFSR